MKKALIILVLLNVSVAFAQSKLRLGVNLDPKITWLSPKTTRIEKDGARPGFSGGLMVEYYFHSNYGFISGLNIGVQGGNLMYKDAENFHISDADTLISPGSTVAFNLSYLTIPFGLKLKTNEIGYLTYFAELGFNTQINVGSRAKSTDKHLNKDIINKEINIPNVSYFIGGGVEYNIGGNTSLLAGVFFNNGFFDVLTNTRHRAASNYLTFRVGILF